MLKKKSHKNRQPRRQTSKVRLTYYRSGSPQSADMSSPFSVRKRTAKPKNLLLKLVDSSVLILLALVFVYSLIITPDVEVSANSYLYRRSEVYKKATDSEIGKLTNRNKLTMDERALVGKLRADFPEIRNAWLELPLIGHTPVLHLDISNPAFVLQSGSDRYVVSSEGIAVGLTSEYPQFSGLQVVEDHSGFRLAKGRPAVSSSTADFINTLWRQLKAKSVPIESMVLPSVPLELNVRTADQQYYTKFHVEGDAALQTGQFLSAREHFVKHGGGPKDYLDVRVPGKVFFK